MITRKIVDFKEGFSEEEFRMFEELKRVHAMPDEDNPELSDKELAKMSFATDTDICSEAAKV